MTRHTFAFCRKIYVTKQFDSDSSIQQQKASTRLKKKPAKDLKKGFFFEIDAAILCSGSHLGLMKHQEAISLQR